MSEQERLDTVFTFFTALVDTIEEIERAQPEPGFKEVFVQLLHKHLDRRALVGDPEIARDVAAFKAVLSRGFLARDLTDAMLAADDDQTC